MQRICSSLQDEFDVIIVGRIWPNSTELSSKPYQQHRLKCHFNKGKLFYLEFQIRLFFYLIFKKFDIIGSIDSDTILPCTFVKILRSKKLVFDAHEYFTEVPELSNRPFTKGIWGIIENACIPLADAAYTVGPGLANIFTASYGIPFECIRNLPNKTVEFESKQENTPLRILYQGALNEGRCLSHLINAVKDFPVKLILAGEGDLSNTLRELVKQNRQENQVEFLGFVKPNELKNLTKTCDIGFNVLEPMGLSYQYSLANKFFDYIHAGIPQICSNFIEYQHLNDTYSVAILSAFDIESIKKSLHLLIESSQLRGELINNCKLATKDLNWALEKEKLNPIYKGL
jgi:glycosyltransferase involved in cell wall biosynthesis